ncbi:hypothetical protein AB1Y20_012739 [Prymnesium parvum]|uniref:Uncharacterized protein n=1 Tax=Prymnesium parvum TaxID=97485 RepID=A0AB34IJP9_PRYPA
MASLPRKREREESEQDDHTRFTPPDNTADNPTDEMDAALALSGMLHRAEQTRAKDLVRFRTTNQFFPCVAGKGWFVKRMDGGDIPFLERLFLILSYPNAALIGEPGRRLGDAIRWKDPEAARQCGAPEGAPCIEIVNVPLFEAEVYPQYASGSFNKTAIKWGLVSPSGPDGAAKKLLRECMYMAPTKVGGKEVYPLRPLSDDTLADDVEKHIARHLRPLAHAHRVPSSAGRHIGGNAEDAPQVTAPSVPDDEQMARIMSVVKETTDYELSEAQLRAILALKGQAKVASRPAEPRLSGGMQQWQQAALTASLASAILGAAATAAPPPAKRQAVAASWDELRVTLWDTKAKKRVSGTSYKGDLSSFLAANPHMEVYNRQDEAPKPGQQLLAGQKMHKIESGKRQDPKVVMWHTTEQRKLSAAESPTQTELYRFLRAHPEIAVYDNQDVQKVDAPSASEPVCKGSTLAGITPLKSSSDSKHAKADGSAQIQLHFKRLTSLDASAMGGKLSNSTKLGPAGSMLSYSALTQLAQMQKPTGTQTSQQYLSQLQGLLQQQAPAADSLAVLQTAQLARILSMNAALTTSQGSDVSWKGQVVLK